MRAFKRIKTMQKQKQKQSHREENLGTELGDDIIQICAMTNCFLRRNERLYIAASVMWCARSTATNKISIMYFCGQFNRHQGLFGPNIRVDFVYKPVIALLNRVFQLKKKSKQIVVNVN